MKEDSCATDTTNAAERGDVGNVAAGYVAGSNGLTWQEARAGFDALETCNICQL